MLPLHHRTVSVKLVEWLADADVPVTVMVYVPDGVPPWGVRVVWPSPRPHAENQISYFPGDPPSTHPLADPGSCSNTGESPHDASRPPLRERPQRV